MLTVLQFYDLPRTMECLGSTSPHQRNQGRTHISPILMPIINRNIDGHWTGHGVLLSSRFIDIQGIHGYNLNTSVWHFGPIQNTLPWGNLLWFPKSGVNQSNGNQCKFSPPGKKMNLGVVINKPSTSSGGFGIWYSREQVLLFPHHHFGEAPHLYKWFNQFSIL